MTATESIDRNVTKLEAQLELWGAKLNELVAKANVTKDQLKTDSRKQIDDLRGKLDVARARLEAAKAVGTEKWGTVKDGLERAWHDVEAALKKALA